MEENKTLKPLTGEGDAYTFESDTLALQARGCDVCAEEYREGEIANHRLFAGFTLNGCEFQLSVHTHTCVYRRINARTGKPLKHPLMVSNHGWTAELYVVNHVAHKACSGAYAMFEDVELIGEKRIDGDKEQTEAEILGRYYPFSQERRLAMWVNGLLRTRFKRIAVIRTVNAQPVTLDQALEHASEFRRFDHTMGDSEHELMLQRAHECFNAQVAAGRVDPREWDEACWISSGDIHGYWFPNSRSGLQCIAFRDVDTLDGVAVYDGQEGSENA